MAEPGGHRGEVFTVCRLFEDLLRQPGGHGRMCRPRGEVWGHKRAFEAVRQ